MQTVNYIYFSFKKSYSDYPSDLWSYPVQEPPNVLPDLRNGSSNFQKKRRCAFWVLSPISHYFGKCSFDSVYPKRSACSDGSSPDSYMCGLQGYWVTGWRWEFVRSVPLWFCSPVTLRLFLIVEILLEGQSRELVLCPLHLHDFCGSNQK